MNGFLRCGLNGLMLAVAVTANSSLAEQSILNGPQIVLFPHHGIQFSWSEMRLLTEKPRPSGGCSWEPVRHVTREAEGCVLNVELARDPATCSSLVQRGTPLNTARCSTPAATTASNDAQWHALIGKSSASAMAASLFALVMVPAYYEWLGQSRSSPGNTDTAFVIPSFLTPGNAPEVAGLH